MDCSEGKGKYSRCSQLENLEYFLEGSFSRAKLISISGEQGLDLSISSSSIASTDDTLSNNSISGGTVGLNRNDCRKRKRRGAAGSSNGTSRDITDDDGTLYCGSFGTDLMLRSAFKSQKPRIMRSDVRRDYATMWANVFNSCDYDHMMRHIHTFYSPDFVMVQKKKGLAAITPICRPIEKDVLHGIHELAAFWHGHMCNTPDLVCSLKHAQLTLRSDGTAVVTAGFLLTGTKLLTAEDVAQHAQQGGAGVVPLHATNSKTFGVPVLPPLPPGVCDSDPGCANIAVAAVAAADHSGTVSSPSDCTKGISENSIPATEQQDLDAFIEDYLPELMQMSDMSDSEDSATLAPHSLSQPSSMQDYGSSSKRRKVRSSACNSAADESARENAGLAHSYKEVVQDAYDEGLLSAAPAAPAFIAHHAQKTQTPAERKAQIAIELGKPSQPSCVCIGAAASAAATNATSTDTAHTASLEEETLNRLYNLPYGPAARVVHTSEVVQLQLECHCLYFMHLDADSRIVSMELHYLN